MTEKDFEKLRAPFPSKDVEWRVSRSGISQNGKPWAQVLAYLTSRSVQNRLDEVCGPGGWQNEIIKEGDVYLCKLSILVTREDGTSEWISKMDGSDETDFEKIKGGISSAIKRAAVHFGIGRYLYDLGTSYANINQNGKLSLEIKDGSGKKQYYKWDPPALPASALPTKERRSTQCENNPSPAPSQKYNSDGFSEQEKQDIVLSMEQYLQSDIWKKDPNKGEAGRRAALSAFNNSDFKRMRDAISYCKNLEQETPA